LGIIQFDKFASIGAEVRTLQGKSSKVDNKVADLVSRRLFMVRIYTIFLLVLTISCNITALIMYSKSIKQEKNPELLDDIRES
jgi:hypothetical protein